MIDIHCHVMPEVDDGSKSLKETIKMFKNAKRSGITDMILTPHYIRETKYCFNNDTKERLLEILQEAIRREELDLNIYLGNEAYIDMELPELVESGEVATLAGSQYLLIELPVGFEDKSAGDVIFNLKKMGITPIIAHPERYEYIQERPGEIIKYLDLGCLLQGDYLSLFGKYGKKAAKTLKLLLKNDKITFLASDIHHEYHDYKLKDAQKKVKHIVRSKEKVEELFTKNSQKILNNESF